MAIGLVGALVDDVAKVVEPARIGRTPFGQPRSRLCPPFHARVVKPRISVATPQRSSVRASMSAQVAAIEIGRPRIDPELSISRLTTVSLKFHFALDLVAQANAPG